MAITRTTSACLRCLTACLCLLFASVIHAEEKLRVGWVYAMANAPIVVAKKKHLFAKHGVSVEIQSFNSGPLIKRALEAGDLDLAYIGMPPVYHAYLKGTMLKIIAKVNTGQAAVITRYDSQVKTLDDLRNRKLASIRHGSGMDVLLRGFILKEHANFDFNKDLKILHMPAKMMHGALQRGIVDAAFTWEPFVSEAVLSDNARVVFDLNKQIPHYPWYVIVASEQTYKHQRKKMSRFLAAHREAIEELKKNTDDTNSMIVEAFRLRSITSSLGVDVTPAEIVKNARTRLGWEYQFTKSDREFLQKLIDYSKDLGFIKRTFLCDEILDQDVSGIPARI